MRRRDGPEATPEAPPGAPAPGRGEGLGEVTIVAPATAPLPAGVGVLRLSGPRSLALARRVCPDVPEAPTPRHAYLTTVRDGLGQVLDEGLFLYFPAPRSYTGEDVVELQLHGSPRLLSLVQAQLLASGEARPAGPGEFTRRAYLNGRLDLSRAEAVADLVSAQSEAELRAAAAQLRGGLLETVARVRTPLLELRADLEGALDFPEEAEGAEVDAAARVAVLDGELGALCEAARRGRVVRSGARVVLFGPVNAGKSTLFNRLLGEERALVDDEPGTTRDVLEARLELEGLTVWLHDTAGLRDSPERLERLGLEKGRSARAGADLVVLVLPPGASAQDAERWRAEAGGAPVLEVEGKADLRPAFVVVGSVAAGRAGAGFAAESVAARRSGAEASAASVSRMASGATSGATVSPRVPGAASAAVDADGAWPSSVAGDATPRLRVSGRTGEGVDELRRAVAAALWGRGAPGAVAALSERHREILERTRLHVARAAQALRESTLEAASGELGLALEALGELTGESASEALLDALFQRFCIGK